MLNEHFEELAKYLPRDVHMGHSLEYTSYHARAISVNGVNSLYTIEYFAFHILWMSFLEKVTHQLYRYDGVGLQQALGNEGNVKRVLETAVSLYDLSAINEKKLCGVVKYPLIGYHPNQISNLRELVEKRDHIAHCSGILDLDENDILQYAKRCVRYTKDIHSRLEVAILASWDGFVTSLNGSGDQFSLVHDAIVEYLSKEYISVADILMIMNKRPLLDSSLTEGNFRSNLARLQLALIVDDYVLDSGVEPNELKAEVLSHRITEEQQNVVNDEVEAYTSFRAGLAR